MRKTYDKAFKAKVALEAIKGEKTIQQIAQDFEIHPNMVALWKKQLIDNASELFDAKRGPAPKEEEASGELFKQIGMLQVENDFLKKKYRQLYGHEPPLLTGRKLK
jgi:transposase